MMQSVLVGCGLALVLMFAVAACWRAYPPAWRPPSRSALLFFPLAALLSAVTLACGTIVAAMAAVFALVAVTVVFLGRARKAWRVQRAIEGFEEKKDSTRGMLELRAALGPEPGRSRRYIVWTRTVAHSAAHLSRKGLHREALDVVGMLDAARLDPIGACVRGQIVAAVSLALGDRAKARVELGRIARPAPSPLYERALVALTMLLDALEGLGPSGASSLAEKVAAETDPNVRSTLRAAHAHALAAEGHRDEAFVVLRAIKGSEVGVRGLERVAAHGGPASPLASALRAEDVLPYR